jgi:gliding motility-associated-like protein
MDQKGCIRVLENLEVEEPLPLQLLAVTPTAASCYGKPDGQVDLQIIGGTAPYQLEYNGIQTFSDQLLLSDIPQGNYEWEVLDANGCRIPVSFEVTSPPALEVEVRLQKPACPGGSNGELFAFPSGGQAPYIYTWEDQSQSANELIGVSRGNYNVSVLDGGGCVSLGRGEVLEEAPILRMPTGFDPTDGVFQGVSNCEINFELSIYNRWGQLIHSGISGWDGTYEGKDVPTGTYSYYLSYSFPLEDRIELVEKRGTFTLIR